MLLEHSQYTLSQRQMLSQRFIQFHSLVSAIVYNDKKKTKEKEKKKKKKKKKKKEMKEKKKKEKEKEKKKKKKKKKKIDNAVWYSWLYCAI